MTKGWVRWVMVGVVALGIGVVVRGEEHGRDAHATTLPFTISKETTGIVGPLREDGTPDYVAAMNARYGKGVAVKDNAFVWWVGVMGTDILPGKMRDEMLRLCGADKAGLVKHVDWKSYESYLGNLDHGMSKKAMEDQEHALSKLWTKEDLPQLADYLDPIAKELDGTRDAFSHSRYWMPCVSKDGTFYPANLSSYSRIARLREVADCLSERALLRAKAGDFAGFLSDAMALKRIAFHLGAAQTVIEQRGGTGIDRDADRTIGLAASSGIFSEEQCKQLEAAIEKLGKFPFSPDAVDVGERWSILDTAILLATGKGAQLESDGIHMGEKEVGWSKVECQHVNWDAVLKRLNLEMDESVMAIKKKTVKNLREAWSVIDGKMAEIAEQRRSLQKDSVETDEEYTKRVGDLILVELWGPYGIAEELRRQAVMQDEMLNALVAAAAYHAGKGKWPEKLSDLVPGYLKAVPENIFGGSEDKEVGYSFSDDGARIAVEIPDGRGKVVEVGVK